MKVLYEDNHLIVVHKESGEIVQGDKTGDTPLSESVKDYLKAEHDKPGNVFLGVAHHGSHRAVEIASAFDVSASVCSAAEVSVLTVSD